jgi:hypothetical protein
MQMPGRSYTAVSAYRYGFNTQEKSDEIGANLFTAVYWEYDSRIGRRWNVDPELHSWESPYSCFANNPIIFTDVLGNVVKPKDEKSKEHLNEDLKKTFGDNARYFSYDPKGNLIFTGKVANFPKEQRKLVRALKGMIQAKTITNIIYEKNSNIKFTQQYKGANLMSEESLKNAGGSATISKEKTETKEAYIFIDPDYQEQNVSYEYYNNPPAGEIAHKEKGNIKFTRTVLFWHEIGESTKPPLTPKVIIFENRYRKIAGLELRSTRDAGHMQGESIYVKPPPPLEMPKKQKDDF